MNLTKRFLLITAFVVSAFTASSAVAQQPAEKLQARTQEWFQDAKLGLFIHWGVYSELGKGEWVMNNDKISITEYEKLPPQFNPTQFDAKEWVSLAKQAGMKYITITSKHHDGFAMWDSKVSDYDIVDRTPYGKDVLKALADECKRQGIKLFFYHSHLDWHHPDYYPRGFTGKASGRPESGQFDRYLDYMDAQIAELASGKYGELGGFWFDGWWDQKVDQKNPADKRTYVDWRLQKTYDLIHSLQPQAIIGNNHHVAPFPGEGFQMFERDLPGQNAAGLSGQEVGTLPLETCDTMNKSWGYNANDHAWKSHKEIVHYVVRAAGNNANLLLNVGPTPEGVFPPEAVKILQELGSWTKKNGETIYGTRGGPMPAQAWGVMTRKGNRIYLHLLDPKVAEEVTLPNTASLKVAKATQLGTKQAIRFSAQPGQDLKLTIPMAARNDIDTIIALDVR